MPIYKIISKRLKSSEVVLQKVDEDDALRVALPTISRKLGIPSMKNYVIFTCNGKRCPIALLDLDIPLKEQGIQPLSYLYVTPSDATPKGANGEELPLATELRRDELDGENDIPPPPPPPPDEKSTHESLKSEAAGERAAEEEAARKRAAEEDAARKRVAEEEATRKRAAEEDAARKRVAEEEAARKRVAEEEATRKRAAEEEAARKRVAEEEAARKRAAEEEAARKRAAEEEAARKRVAEEEATRKRAAEEEAARKRAAEEEAARKRAAEEEAARKRVAEEEAARKRAAEEEAARKREAEKKKVVLDCGVRGISQRNGACCEPLRRPHSEALGDGYKQSGVVVSAEIENHVLLNLVPDVIGVPALNDGHIYYDSGVPGEVAHVLAAVAKSNILHHSVLLRLADVVMRHRPNRPQVFVWSHLQSKLGGTQVIAQPEKNGLRHRTSAPSLSFAPVGDTVLKRLTSGAPAGPSRTVLQYWVKLLFEVKPDNPTLFMWSKLEAKVGKELLGMTTWNSTQNFVPENPTTALLLRDVPRGSASYAVLRSITDFMFEKKPDAPERWILYHLVGRLKSGGSSSESFLAMPLRVSGEESVGGMNGIFKLDDDGDTKRDLSRTMMAIQSLLRDRSAASFSLAGDTKRQTRDASTQTSSLLHVNGEANSGQTGCAPRVKSVSPNRLTSFMHDLSPRELLQLPVLCYHPPFFRGGSLCSNNNNIIRRYDVTAPEVERLHSVSPLRQKTYELPFYPLECPSNSVPHESCFPRQRDSSPLHRNDRGFSVGSPCVQERSSGNELQRYGVGLMSPHDKLRSPASSPTGDFSIGGSADLRYLTRQEEAERAETLYRYNWLLQWEVLRNEQLQREVALLRQEKEMRERGAACYSSPSSYMTLGSEAAALVQEEAQARLAYLTMKGQTTAKGQHYLLQPPFEEDIVGKRLELRSMERARSRHPSLSPGYSMMPGAEELADKRTTSHDMHGNSMLPRGGDCKHNSPMFCMGLQRPGS